MTKTTLAVFLLVIMVVTASVIYLLFYRTEERILPVVVIRADINPYVNRVVAIEVLDEARKVFILERIDAVVDDDVWNNLKMGDKLVLTHHVEYFKIFDKNVFVRNHHDKLQSF